MSKEGPSRTLVRLPKADDKEGVDNTATPSQSKNRSQPTSQAEELLLRLQGTSML